MGKRGRKPKSNISTDWSPDLAYAVGLIATDGCLVSDGRHIELTSKDKEQIVTFRRILNLSRIKIGKKSSGTTDRKKYYRIQFGDVLFYQWLNEIGLTANKSKTIGVLKIPDKFFFDFLRGCFDGDGCIYAYWDPRWHSSYMFYISFAGASLLFLEWLQKNIIDIAKINGKISSSVKARSYQLRFAKENSLILFNKMYHSRNLPYLERKFTKAQKIFNIDKGHSELK